MRILLTGSNGFVGSAITRAAHRRGWHVSGVGRAPQSSPVVADSEPDDYISADLSLGFDWQPDHPIDVVIHCAALSSPWASPEAFITNNVRATVHVAEHAERNGSPHLIYISSASVFYRDEDQVDMTEATPIPPDEEQINLYSRSKAVSERYLNRYPGKVTIMRPRAVYGPGDPVLLPRVLAAAKAGRLPVFTRADSPVICDLTHVDVIGEYVARAAEGGHGGHFNLTGGQPVELYPFIFELFDRLGIAQPTRRIPVAAGMAAARAAEVWSATRKNYREPLITRYGISMFAYSKTFDVTKTRTVLGEPHLAHHDAVESLVHWYLEEQP